MGKQAVGYKSRTTLDFEDTYGAMPSPQNGYTVPFNSSDVGQSQNLIEANTITGTRSPVQPALGRISVEGNNEIPVDFNAFGVWLKAGLGQPVTTDNGDGTYTHEFKIGDSQPSFVMAREFPDLGKTFVFRGCKLGSLSLPFGGDNELVATAAIIGKDRIYGNGEYDPDAKVMKLNRVNNYMASVYENGTKNCDVRGGELTIDFGLDGDQYTLCNGNSRGDIPEGLVNISGSAEFIFNSMSMLTVADEAMIRSLDIQFGHGKNLLKFHFPEIQWDVTDPSVTGPAGIVYKMNWRAFWRDSAAESAMIVMLTNEVEEY